MIYYITECERSAQRHQTQCTEIADHRICASKSSDHFQRLFDEKRAAEDRFGYDSGVAAGAGDSCTVAPSLA